jgi:ubiquinone/menaquinone biosynthesis C-methylase UbiE
MEAVFGAVASAVVERLPPSDPEDAQEELRVLDLGCGNGDGAISLAQALLGQGARRRIKIVGTDRDGDAVSAATAQSSEFMKYILATTPDGAAESLLEFQFVVADAQELPAGFAQTFDAVVCQQTIQYCDAPDVVLSECARVLKPLGENCGFTPSLRCTHPPIHPLRCARALTRTLCALAPAQRFCSLLCGEMRSAARC